MTCETALHIDSRRLTIRPLAPGDEAGYCRLVSEPAVAARIVGAFGPNGELRFISTLDADEKSAMFKQRQVEMIGSVPSRYAIVLRGGDEFIGSIGSYAIDEDRIGLSYWLGTAHHGKGFGTEALRAYCAPALRRFGRRFMLANVELDNAASLSALCKAGFTDFDAAASPSVRAPADRVFLQFVGGGVAYSF